MFRKKVLLLSGLVMMSLITSCGNTNTPDEKDPIQPEKIEYHIRKDDSTKVSSILGDSFSTNENTTYKVSDSRFARIIGDKLFAIKPGTVSVEAKNDQDNFNFDVIVEDYEEYSDIETTSSGCSISGYLIDAMAGSAFIKDRTYDYTFSPKNATDGDTSYSIVVSDPDIVEFDENDGSYTFTTKKVGNSVVKFVNADGFTNATFVIKVRAGYDSTAEYLFALQRYDYRGGFGFFDGWYKEDSTKITFLDDTSGVFSGSDQGKGFDPITFNYEVMEEEDNDDYTVLLKVTNFQNPQQTFDLSYIRLFKSGDRLMTYAGEGANSRLNELYFPKMNS